MRTVSGASAAEILLPITQPGFLVELQFSTGTIRLSSFGTITWNSLTWTGANMQVDGFAGDGKAARVSLWDANAAFRTLVLTGGGIRNRTIKIWQAQYPALAVGDPNMVFYGVGDSASIAQGRVDITCARLNSLVLMAPRQRISPATGFNFLAAAGRVVQWGDVVITLQPANR